MVLAGFVDDEAIDRNDCFALIAGRWIRLTSTPGLSIDGALMVVGDELWNLGNGARGEGSRAYSFDTWKYIDLGADERVQKQVSDGRFIVSLSRITPYGGGVQSPDAVYSLKSHLIGSTGWIELSMPPLGLEAHLNPALCCLDGIVYVIGQLTMQAYDLETRTWSVKPSMPHRRAGASTVAVDGNIFVVGGSLGWRDEVQFRSVISFDPETETWSDDYPELPIGRKHYLPWGMGMSPVSHEGKLAVFGPNWPPLILENGAWETLPDVFPPTSGERISCPVVASLKLW